MGNKRYLMNLLNQNLPSSEIIRSVKCNGQEINSVLELMNLSDIKEETTIVSAERQKAALSTRALSSISSSSTKHKRSKGLKLGKFNHQFLICNLSNNNYMLLEHTTKGVTIFISESKSELLERKRRPTPRDKYSIICSHGVTVFDILRICFQALLNKYAFFSWNCKAFCKVIMKNMKKLHIDANQVQEDIKKEKRKEKKRNLMLEKFQIYDLSFSSYCEVMYIFEEIEVYIKPEACLIYIAHSKVIYEHIWSAQGMSCIYQLQPPSDKVKVLFQYSQSTFGFFYVF